MRAAIIFLVITAATALPPRSRIYGGKNATTGQFPFMVALNHPDQFCDGAIIDTKWILTAGHCLQDLNALTKVLVGTNQEHSGGTEYSVLKAIIHEDYQADGHNDIGLVQIDGTLEYSDTVQPVALGGGEKAKETCIAVGWGVTESVEFPEIVQYVELTTIELNLCKEMAVGFADGYYLGPEQVCTLADVGKGTCFGDSGGPLICGGKLAGVTAWGVKPCALGYPDIFTSFGVRRVDPEEY